MSLAKGRTPPGPSTRFVWRVRLLTAGVALVALLVVGRLYVLQIMHGEEYLRRSDAQSVELLNPLLNRGAIYFSDKSGALVTAATLHDLSAEVAATSTPASTKQRYYPGGSLAAHTIGFVAYNNDNEQKGRYGLERYYEETLGRSGESLYTNFFVELFGGVKEVLEGTPQKGDLLTTIEPTVQSELERTLEVYAKEWNPALLGGIVMVPTTGEIVALAILPTFDLNSFNTEESVRVFNNPVAQSVFEMGSIIKPLTIAAGLDAGAITEATTYNDTGCITLDEKKICNYDLKARGTIPMQEILNQSLNLGVSFVAGKMGPETMRGYFLDRYKLGEETGIDLPGEVRGLVENIKSSRQVEFATASFGQGVATTPIETVRALASLANGGYLVTPHLGRAVRGENGLVRELGWGEPVRVLKPETTTAISRMLTTVVDTSLAGGKIKLDHWSVAAKTGTAQIADPQGGGYYADRFLHSFFGYFPAQDARFIIFLFANEPTGAPFASQTWAMPFKSLTQFLINYYNIPPDR